MRLRRSISNRFLEMGASFPRSSIGDDFLKIAKRGCIGGVHSILHAIVGVILQDENPHLGQRRTDGQGPVQDVRTVAIILNIRMTPRTCPRAWRGAEGLLAFDFSSFRCSFVGCSKTTCGF